MSDVVELLLKGVVVGLFQTNCYIVGSRRTGEAVCIDPGAEPEEVLALARDLGVRITRVISTHAHLDHIMGVGALKDATGAPFLLHPGDTAIARAVPQAAAMWLGASVPPPPAADFQLHHGDDLEVAGISLRVLHTPGHTPGSVSLYAPGMLFSGDTLFRGSIGRTDLFGGDRAEILRSITTQLLALPDETIVLPGHMQETTIGTERAGNPFILAALERLADS